MAKRPFPGQTKTRLTPPFSATEAAELYACFLYDVLDLVRTVPGVTPFIAYAPPDAATAAYFHKLVPDFELIPQPGNTLGGRLDTVLRHCLRNGYMQAAAMNSDSPTLPAAYLAEAFTRLDDPAVDVTLGPCEDGGYYLIGCKRPISRLVRGVQMSTDHVLQDTLAIAEAEKLCVSLLPAWYDVDERSDLHRLRTELQTRPETARRTSQFLQCQ